MGRGLRPGAALHPGKVRDHQPRDVQLTRGAPKPPDQHSCTYTCTQEGPGCLGAAVGCELRGWIGDSIPTGAVRLPLLFDCLSERS